MPTSMRPSFATTFAAAFPGPFQVKALPRTTAARTSTRRGGRATTTTPRPAAPQVAPVLVAPVASDKAARREEWKKAHGHQVKLARVVRTGKNAGVAYTGKTANAAYVVAWNRTTKVWDWSLQNGRGTKPVMGSAPDRAAAFAGLNAAARKAKVSEVRA